MRLFEKSNKKFKNLKSAKEGEHMAFDYSKLKGRIVERFGSQRAFAEKLGITEVSLTRKMQNQAAWKQSEIVKAKNLLGIPPEETDLYFFTINV